MARPDVRGRQLTLYLESREDLKRWRKLAEPYPLSKWIRLTIEKAITEKPIRTKDADEIDALKKRNLELEQENEVLTTRLEKTQAKQVEILLEKAKGPMQLDKEVVDLLRTGGVWSSARIMKTLDVIKMVNKGEFPERTKSIKTTLEVLNNLNLVEYTGTGWTWKR
jgi:hypothetical protein